ncbi:thiosulfate/3-mercaptopyruvate sulfurtransferase [Kineococcus xinjiangensis]|uniref:Thiosulfate/3-mercaptopyruvate sulfurtransferase n=1 Tax=Kineococcus xinjiangensis TaxID=512762 RepID=A0A2S6ITQ3_9ACTN|nr:sulfurtransferase [Kineococcus xinjiangensis]PPK97632.1 thiosulfate/3-mercaptopyruvate sulfurtransferase [Kineococcus xinjiangensis]
MSTPAPPDRARTFTDVAELRRLLDAGAPLLLLDVRWRLGDTTGRERHREGHLPGAVYVDLDAELSAPPSPAHGRHPLPDPAALQESARRWGLRPGMQVVAYDDAGGAAAARAWWVLRWAGWEEVRILDGGLAAWRAAGLPLEAGEVEPAPGDVEPGDVELSPGAMPVVDADGAAALPASGLLLDARAGERYRGEVEPVDPRAGHVPGARNLPPGSLTDGEGLLLPADVLRERLAQVGVRPGVATAAYCGSGVFASLAVAQLAAAGIEAALYPGSWSQWSSDPARPAATGREP